MIWVIELWYRQWSFLDSDIIQLVKEWKCTGTNTHMISELSMKKGYHKDGVKLRKWVSLKSMSNKSKIKECIM